MRGFFRQVVVAAVAARMQTRPGEGDLRDIDGRGSGVPGCSNNFRRWRMIWLLCFAWSCLRSSRNSCAAHLGTSGPSITPSCLLAVASSFCAPASGADAWPSGSACAPPLKLWPKNACWGSGVREFRRACGVPEFWRAGDGRRDLRERARPPGRRHPPQVVGARASVVAAFRISIHDMTMCVLVGASGLHLFAFGDCMNQIDAMAAPLVSVPAQCSVSIP